MSPSAQPAPGVPDSALADTVLHRLTRVYPEAAEPERAIPTAAYMRNVAPFLGIAAPHRRALSRAVLAGTGRPDEADCTAVAQRCWELPERAYQCFAADFLRRVMSGAAPRASCPSCATS
ncbi:hypothetical protein GCM10020227_56950 [Streptomyces flavovirens]